AGRSWACRSALEVASIRLRISLALRTGSSFLRVADDPPRGMTVAGQKRVCKALCTKDLKHWRIMFHRFPRRRFLRKTLALGAWETLPENHLSAAATVSKALPAWKPGVLEIHHIATNRGNSALLILPDRTTMMVDAGAIYGTTPYLSDPLPSGQRRPGEWIGR